MSNQGANDVLVLSTGVVLKTQAVPAWKLKDLASGLERPVPPMIKNAEGREFPNPDDQQYLKAQEKYEADLSERMNDYLIVLGTDIVSVPENFPSMDDKVWREKIEWSGTKIGESRLDVYLAWVKYIAGPLMADIQKIILEVGRKSGVSEADVKTATENFRRSDQ